MNMTPEQIAGMIRALVAGIGGAAVASGAADAAAVESVAGAAAIIGAAGWSVWSKRKR